MMFLFVFSNLTLKLATCRVGQEVPRPSHENQLVRQVLPNFLLLIRPRPKFSGGWTFSWSSLVFFFFFNVRCKHLNKTDQQEVESAFSRWVEYHLVSSLTKMHVRKCERCCSILIGDIKGIVLVNNNVISRSFSMERRWCQSQWVYFTTPTVPMHQQGE
jgi:hypothetical protein